MSALGSAPVCLTQPASAALTLEENGFFALLLSCHVIREDVADSGTRRFISSRAILTRERRRGCEEALSLICDAADFGFQLANWNVCYCSELKV
jgi:hypothetical protein